MNEEILPETDYERQMVRGIRIEMMDRFHPNTFEELAEFEEKVLARITRCLEQHRSEDWVEEIDESDFEPEPWVVSLSALDGTMEEMARAAAFFQVETEGSSENPALFYEIRSEDKDLEAD